LPLDSASFAINTRTVVRALLLDTNNRVANEENNALATKENKRKMGECGVSSLLTRQSNFDINFHGIEHVSMLSD